MPMPFASPLRLTDEDAKAWHPLPVPIPLPRPWPFGVADFTCSYSRGTDESPRGG